MDDSVDRAIVAEIARDGRATLSHLSDAVGLSVSAVQSRLRRLETRGVITGYRAILDPELVGTPLEHLDAIEACHSIAGDASYMLFVRVASPRALEELVRDIRTAANVSTRTTVVLQTYYEHRPILPVE
jgi:Lrp/AsnC family leucine-responsive transcriptional regulator